MPRKGEQTKITNKNRKKDRCEHQWEYNVGKFWTGMKDASKDGNIHVWKGEAGRHYIDI